MYFYVIGVGWNEKESEKKVREVKSREEEKKINNLNCRN
jgi:hypothetical protein